MGYFSLLIKNWHIEDYHADDDENTDYSPDKLNFFLIFFAQEKHMRYDIIISSQSPMLDFKEKKKTRRFIYSTPVVAFLGIVFLFFSYNLFGLHKISEESQRKTNEAKAELRILEERKRDLEKRVSFLKTERGQESEIREKFMVGKEGEGVILLVDQPHSTTTKIAPPKPSFWSGFLDFFR